jgi:hypothetical protein
VVEDIQADALPHGWPWMNLATCSST